MYVRYENKSKKYKVSMENGLLTLFLSYRKIVNIKKIIGLDNLSDLQVLYLNYNRIKEITDLEKLSNLQVLHLDNNNIEEITGLESLSNLQKLYIRENSITEISGLENLSSLQKLYLGNNYIKEITGLENLSNLQVLYLIGNNIKEITGLENLSNLQVLYLNNNNIEEITGLESLSNLQKLYLLDNKITEIKGLSNLNDLTQLGLYGNPVYKWAKNKFKNRKASKLGYNSIYDIQDIVKYCWKNERAMVEAIQYIKELPSIYEEISFEDIRSKTEIEIAELRKIMEKLILEGQLEAKIRGNAIYFTKSPISGESMRKEKERSFKPLEKMRNSTAENGTYFKSKEHQKVFLSYSTLNSDYFQISNIAKILTSYPEIEEVLFWEADSGENIVEYMERTLKRCSVFVLFCSKNALNSKAVTDEWQAAFQLRKKGSLKIIPVYADESFIPVLLTPLLNVEFSNENFIDFILKLYKEILRK